MAIKVTQAPRPDPVPSHPRETRANDEAAAAARRAAQQADKKADTQHRDNEKTLGRNIDTTA